MEKYKINIKVTKDVLNEFINNGENKAILIDGPWGCGKTHQINECMKNFNKINLKDKNKIYYVSLFGLESINEIHTALYYQMFPRNAKAKKITKYILHGTSVISKAIPCMERVGNVCDGLDAQLGNVSKEKIRKNSIIVFDDLERISTSISYINLFGYINGLFSMNCKIICLANSKEIHNDTDFITFKEKVFDSIYTISETNIELMYDMFKEYDISNIQYAFKLFENNLRMAKKTKIFYDKISKIFKNNNASIKEAKQSEYIIFEAAIYTVLVVLRTFEKNDKNYSKYETDKKVFGESVANGLKFYFGESQNDFEMNTISHLTRRMLYLFMFNGKNELEKYFFPQIDDKCDSILNKEFFYLSDANKKNYFFELEKLIQSGEYELKDIVSKISNIVKNYNYEFSDLTIKNIAKSYINEFDENIDYVEFNLYFNNVEKSDIEKKFLNNVKNEIENLIMDDSKSKIQLFKKNKEYRKLCDFINSILIQPKQYGINIINEYLINDNFYMPNLSGDITGDEWGLFQFNSKIYLKS